MIDFDSAREEMAQADLVRPLDPDHQYFVYPSRGCYLVAPGDKSLDEAIENDIDRCPLSRDKRYVNLIMPDGGQEFGKVAITAENLYPYMNVTNLIDGLARLHANGIAHNDIKPPNILALYDGSAFHTRLIDFGLSVRFADLAMQPASAFSLYDNTIYAVWSLELMFVKHKEGPARYPSQSRLDRFYAENIEFNYGYAKRTFDFPKNMYYVREGVPLLKFLLVENLVDETYKIADRTVRLGFLFKASDAFAFGRTLSSMYARITGHADTDYYSAEHIQILEEGEYVDPVNYGQRAGYSAETADYHRALAEQVSLPFYKFIRRLVHPNPYERPAMNAALREEYIATVLDPMARLFTPENVERHILNKQRPALPAVPTPVPAAPPSPPSPSPSPSPIAAVPSARMAVNVNAVAAATGINEEAVAAMYTPNYGAIRSGRNSIELPEDVEHMIELGMTTSFANNSDPLSEARRVYDAHKSVADFQSDERLASDIRMRGLQRAQAIYPDFSEMMAGGGRRKRATRRKAARRLRRERKSRKSAACK